jgi:hypothetical protein
VHIVTGTVGAPFQITGAAIASSGKPAKYVFALNPSNIAVINDVGELWCHALL